MRMTRRGSLEWSLETVGKLIFYALIIVALIYMGIKLVDLFTRGEHDWRAKQNFNYLERQIERVQEDGVERSVIVQMPQRTAIAGFDADEKELQFLNDLTLASPCEAEKDDLVAPPNLLKPSDCGSSACICALRFDYSRGLLGCADLQATVLACKKLEGKYVDDPSRTLSSIDIYTGSRDFWLDWDMKFTAKGDVVAISQDRGAASYTLTKRDNTLFIAPAGKIPTVEPLTSDPMEMQNPDSFPFTA